MQPNSTPLLPAVSLPAQLAHVVARRPPEVEESLPPIRIVCEAGCGRKLPALSKRLARDVEIPG
jgi:hypothetical protein